MAHRGSIPDGHRLQPGVTTPFRRFVGPGFGRRLASQTPHRPLAARAVRGERR
jgi:hypothetical protein